MKQKTTTAYTSINKKAWNTLKSNPLSMVSLFTIALSLFIAAFAPLLSPDKSPNANQQHLEICTKRPGFSCTFLRIKKNYEPTRTSLLRTIFYGKENKFTEHAINSFHIENEFLIYEPFSEPEDKISMPEKRIPLHEICYPLASENYSLKESVMAFYTSDSIYIESSLDDLKSMIVENHIVKKRFLLGTDQFGRDVLSRMIVGARVSISVGFIAVLISLLVGLSLGLIAGYYRGITDHAIMWLINVIWSVPTLLMVIAITMVIGKGFWVVFLAVGLTMWVEVARVTRGQVLSLREKEFILAAKSLGFSDFRIILKHILPNIISPLIIISAANFASSILIEAGLSFLGIGVQPPIPSWGSMIKAHYGYIIMNKAYLAIIPGLAIMTLVLAFTLLGNGLREALNSKE